MADSETPVPGQSAVFKRADGLYDVITFGEAGERTRPREGLKQFVDAYHIARNALTAGRVLYADHLTPDVFEKYTFSK